MKNLIVNIIFELLILYNRIPYFGGKGLWRFRKFLKLNNEWLTPIVVRRIGFLWFIHSFLNNASMSLILDDPYDINVANAIKKYVREGDLVIDIGANIGYFTLILSRVVGAEGRVIGYEPSNFHSAILKRNLNLNKLANVEFYEIALGSKKETTVLYTTESSGSTISDFSHIGMKTVAQNTVEVQSLDGHLNELSVTKRVTFIKLDVDGAEIEILKGAEKTITRDMPIIVFEIAKPVFDLIDSSVFDILEFLEGFGYCFFNGLGHKMNAKKLASSIKQSSELFFDIIAEPFELKNCE